MKTSLIVLALLGVAVAVPNTIRQKLVQTTQNTPSQWLTCNGAIKRVKEAKMSDTAVSSAISAGTQFVDPNFYPKNSGDLYNPNYPRNKWNYPELKDKFCPIHELKPTYTLYGSTGHPTARGINQGGLGDCWYLQALAAIAEHSSQIEGLLKQSSMNKAGVYQAKFYAMGRQHTVVVDDYIPTYYNQIWFTKWGKDHGCWGPILEKAFAKFNGVYESIVSGSPKEAFYNLLGEASVMHKLEPFRGNTTSSIELWSKIEGYDKQGLVMSCSSNSANTDGVVGGHAYTLVGVVEPSQVDNDSDCANLVIVRNPWGTERYHGKFSDKDNSTVAAKCLSKMNHTKSNDGVFIMDIHSFVNDFNYMYAAETYKGRKHTLHDVENADKEESHRYDLEIPSGGVTKASLTIRGWPDRMYAHNCISSWPTVLVTLIDPSGNYLKNTWVPTAWAYTFRFKTLAAGKYTLKLKPNWKGETDIVKELTIDFAGSSSVTIKKYVEPKVGALIDFLKTKTQTSGRTWRYSLNICGETVHAYRNFEFVDHNKVFYNGLRLSGQPSGCKITKLFLYLKPDNAQYAVTTGQTCEKVQGYLRCSFNPDSYSQSVIKSTEDIYETYGYGSLSYSYRYTN